MEIILLNIKKIQFQLKLSQTLWKLAKDSKNVAHLCGVPYTALPFATAISVESNIPMLIKRKEAKSHGTKELIEGKFESGGKCVIIEDVILFGNSVLETIKDLRNAGLQVTEVFVVLANKECDDLCRWRDNPHL